MELWSESKTAPLVALQKTLLSRAADMLRPGGTVLYSTCTTNIEENEAQVAWAMDQLSLELEPLSEPDGFVFGEPLLPGMDGVLRVAEASEGQGFFLARFRKKDDQGAIEGIGVQKRVLPGSRVDLDRILGCDGLALKNLPAGEAYDFGGKVYFLHEQALRLIPASLRWQGFPLGKVAGRGAKARFRPGPMARVLLPSVDADGPLDVFDVADTDILERLLTGQSLTFKPGKGPVGLYYRGVPLGWLSRKGNRLVWTAK